MRSAQEMHFVGCEGVIDIRYLDCGGQFTMDIHMDYETAMQTYTILLCQLFKLDIKYGRE